MQTAETAWRAARWLAAAWVLIAPAPGQRAVEAITAAMVREGWVEDDHLAPNAIAAWEKHEGTTITLRLTLMPTRVTVESPERSVRLISGAKLVEKLRAFETPVCNDVEYIVAMPERFGGTLYQWMRSIELDGKWLTLIATSRLLGDDDQLVQEAETKRRGLVAGFAAFLDTDVAASGAWRGDTFCLSIGEARQELAPPAGWKRDPAGPGFAAWRTDKGGAEVFATAAPIPESADPAASLVPSLRRHVAWCDRAGVEYSVEPERVGQTAHATYTAERDGVKHRVWLEARCVGCVGVIVHASAPFAGDAVPGGIEESIAAFVKGWHTVGPASAKRR